MQVEPILNFKKIALFVLGATAYIFLFGGGNARAASGVGLNNYFPNPNNSTQPMYLAVAKGEFNADVAGATLLTSGTGTVTITIEDGEFCRRGRDVPNTWDQSTWRTNFRASRISGTSLGAMKPGGADTDNSFSPRCNASNYGNTLSFSINIDDADYQPNLSANGPIYAVALWGSIDYGRGCNAAIPSCLSRTWENLFRFVLFYYFLFDTHMTHKNKK